MDIIEREKVEKMGSLLDYLNDTESIRLGPGEAYDCVFRIKAKIEHIDAKVAEIDGFAELLFSWYSQSAGNETIIGELSNK